MRSTSSAEMTPAPVRGARMAATALASVVFALLLVWSAAGTAASASGPIVSTGTASLGRVLITGSGQTLYLFERTRTARALAQGSVPSSGRR
jgi:predicted lipoprotein with Yx(FWY)xxD motif